MFNNLGFFNRPSLRKPVRRVRPIYPIIQQGGSGNDIFYNNITVISAPSPVPVTQVTTPTYTATVRDYFLCVDHVGLVTITLPVSILGTVYVIKDCSGNARTYPIRVQGTGQTVDGSVSFIDTNYGSLSFIFNGSEWSIV